MNYMRFVFFCQYSVGLFEFARDAKIFLLPYNLFHIRRVLSLTAGNDAIGPYRK